MGFKVYSAKELVLVDLLRGLNSLTIRAAPRTAATTVRPMKKARTGRALWGRRVGLEETLAVFTFRRSSGHRRLRA